MKKQIPNMLLALSFVTTITYFIYTIANSFKVINQLSTVVSISIMSIFVIFFLYICITNDNLNKKYIVIASILLTAYSGFNLLNDIGILKLPNQIVLENFTNKNISYALKWGKENKININQNYEYSDTVKEYNIISQNVNPNTLIKNVKNLSLIVSSGPSYKKDVLIPSMIGWKFDDVMNFIESNYLINVDIEFIISNEEKDTVINQEGSGNLVRDHKISLVFSKGKEEDIKDINIKDLSNKSLFYSTTYLKRYSINYELVYEYDKDIKKDYVIKQNIKDTVIKVATDKVVLTISKGSKIIVPNLLKMKVEDITAWIIENKLKVEFNDSYDDNIKIGFIISSNIKEKEEIEEGYLVKLVVSKGSLKLEKFDTVKEYKDWFLKYNVLYEEVYEFNNDVKKGNIIKLSKDYNSEIKKEETITIYISQGVAVKLPNFIGKSKNEISKICNNLDINCNFIYGGFSDTVKYNIATNQSKTAGSEIVMGTSISITLSKGEQEKVTIPNFINKSKSEVISICNNIGINCNIGYETNFNNNVSKDLVTYQSINNGNIVIKGSSINITLSKGSARTYNIFIQDTFMAPNDPNGTKNKLISKLSGFEGVIFIYDFVNVNTGVGLLTPDSDVKIGNNVFIEGHTYHIRIGS
ncbi:MAG: PASTA domain-containing protein [Bacilli bacterium]